MTMPIDPVAAITGKTPEKRQIPHSISAANTYRQCPRLYHNKYVLGWEEVGEVSWLSFGSKIDRLLEVIDTSNLTMALQAAKDEFPDPYDYIDAECLLTLWDRSYGSTDPLKPIDLNGKPGNQYPVYIPFQGNDVTGFMNMTVSGRIDKVTIVEGEVGVFEGKTTSKAIDSNSDYWKRLDMDPQIACYAWALSKELGKPVNWIQYQVIRRPSTAANTNFSRTYVKAKEVHKFTVEEYRQRVGTIIKGFPAMQKTLVARKKVFIDEERKTQWITEHAQTYLEIQEKKRKMQELKEAGLPIELAWPRNNLGCDMYGGCPFWDCCIGKTTIEGSARFQKRKDWK